MARMPEAVASRPPAPDPKVSATVQRQCFSAETIITLQKNRRRVPPFPVGTETPGPRMLRRSRGERPSTLWWRDPVKKRGPGTLEDLRVVTRVRDPV